ncbi:MAG: hypothetical protein K9L68_10745, partial [Spirochaetales bacterium]|nr:hypothetical protein [Spirochaetales bacterium]MCF7939062.1 hypothetical protein [Spirochaetales bacterium]
MNNLYTRRYHQAGFLFILVFVLLTAGSSDFLFAKQQQRGQNKANVVVLPVSQQKEGDRLTALAASIEDT